MRKGFITTLATAVVALVIGVAPVTAASPHFVPSAWTGITDKYTGDYTIGYMVAGLGNDGSGKVTTKGWFRMSCDGPNANLAGKKWTRRTVERFTFESVDGMNRDYDTLHANPCQNNRNFTGFTIEWACVSATLSSTATGDIYDQQKFFWDVPDGTKCDRLR